MTAPATARPSTVTIHHMGDPVGLSMTAIISVAARLQDYLLAIGAIPEGHPLPFPGLKRRAD